MMMSDADAAADDGVDWWCNDDVGDDDDANDDDATTAAVITGADAHAADAIVQHTCHPIQREST